MRKPNRIRFEARKSAVIFGLWCVFDMRLNRECRIRFLTEALAGDVATMMNRMREG